ncbi:MAG: carboxylesterase family protein [Deltaproteobacteria bacterium]|jgi:para-nitrobenzyl esterase|nr:carboxylesterase family protein [Deltaproteobacteria bacterium]
MRRRKRKRHRDVLLIALLVAIATIALCPSPAKAADGDRVNVDTPLGPVVGQARNGVSVFLGLPFAGPPVGEYRFAPPRDPQGWKEPREAFRPGPMCVQAPMELFQASVAPDNAFPGYSEDCLYLNVWAPEGAKAGDGLPVYVFIHGGGYSVGSGSEKGYDGSALAREGLVVVNVNYRLGALGFLASKETMAQYGTTGNWGLLDQVKALEWVRDNVTAFGGDPAKVTIGGESAGSFSVSGLILSPLAGGLFRQAIMQSGTILALDVCLYPKGEPDLAYAIHALFASLFKAKDDAAGLAKLRALDPALLIHLSPFSVDFTTPSLFGPSPIKDGHVLPPDPMGTLAKGEGKKVKVLMGFNGNEGSMFVPARDDGDVPPRYADSVGAMLGLEGAKAFWDRFPVDKDHGMVERVRQAVSYAFMSSNMKRFADLHARKADVYFYRFDYVTGLGEAAGLGAYHTSELPFVFGNKEALDNSSHDERALSDDIRLRWVNFIKNGDPNVGLDPPTRVAWPRYDPKKPEAMVFGKTVSAKPLPDADNLEFVADIIYGPLPQTP